MRIVLVLVCLLVAGGARAGSDTASVTFNSLSSVKCTALGPFTTPVAVGTVVAKCVVGPAGWTGTLTLAQPPGADFVLTNVQGGDWSIVVGSTAYGLGGIAALKVTAAP